MTDLITCLLFLGVWLAGVLALYGLASAFAWLWGLFVHAGGGGSR